MKCGCTDYHMSDCPLRSSIIMEPDIDDYILNGGWNDED
jgi:hypothetical protein